MDSLTPVTRMLRTQAARVILMDNEQVLDAFLLASENLIGRGVTNDIVLPDRSIATRHARIMNDGEGYLLENLSDANPVALNGIPVPARQPALLKEGDRIDLGNLSLRFESGN